MSWSWKRLSCASRCLDYTWRCETREHTGQDVKGRKIDTKANRFRPILKEPTVSDTTSWYNLSMERTGMVRGALRLLLGTNGRVFVRCYLQRDPVSKFVDNYRSFGMVFWSVMLNDASPVEHLEVIDRGKEAIESLLELAIKTLNGYSFDIAQITITTKVLRSTLHAHPEKRNLQAALSFLQPSEIHEVKISRNIENQNIKSLGLFSVPTLQQSKTFSISDQKYEATARDFHHVCNISLGF